MMEINAKPLYGQETVLPGEILLREQPINFDPHSLLQKGPEFQV